MKVFTNKYPILGMAVIDMDNTVDKESIEVQFEEGKVFKVVGVIFDDFILECDSRVVSIKATAFGLAFTETELAI